MENSRRIIYHHKESHYDCTHTFNMEYDNDFILSDFINDIKENNVQCNISFKICDEEDNKKYMIKIINDEFIYDKLYNLPLHKYVKPGAYCRGAYGQFVYMLEVYSI